MELQQIFDTVATHLLTQNCKSTSGDATGTVGGCAYRGDNGTTCAVGCLIPDNMYLITMECQNIANDAVWAALCPVIGANENVKREKYDLLEDLQSVHDYCAVSDWPNRLQKCANDFNLTFTPLPEGA